jgi:hypothetical protein
LEGALEVLGAAFVAFFGIDLEEGLGTDFAPFADTFCFLLLDLAFDVTLTADFFAGVDFAAFFDTFLKPLDFGDAFCPFLLGRFGVAFFTNPGLAAAFVFVLFLPDAEEFGLLLFRVFELTCLRALGLEDLGDDFLAGPLEDVLLVGAFLATVFDDVLNWVDFLVECFAFAESLPDATFALFLVRIDLDTLAFCEVLDILILLTGIFLDVVAFELFATFTL